MTEFKISKYLYRLLLGNLQYIDMKINLLCWYRFLHFYMVMNHKVGVDVLKTKFSLEQITYLYA